MTTRFIPIEKLDKSINYVIVGVQRCGTTALWWYMTHILNLTVQKQEFSFLRPHDAENHDYSNFTPIIITRNPIQRAWSDMNYFKVSLKEACDNSFYKAGLQMWDCLIYSLEDLQKLPNFPKINTGNYQQITKDEKNTIKRELKLTTYF